VNQPYPSISHLYNNGILPYFQDAGKRSHTIAVEEEHLHEQSAGQSRLERRTHVETGQKLLNANSVASQICRR
jgi:hypothetical protein